MTILKPEPGNIVQTKAFQYFKKPSQLPTANVPRSQVQKPDDSSNSDDSSDLSSDGTETDGETGTGGGGGPVLPPTRGGEIRTATAKPAQAQSLTARQPEEAIQKVRREIPWTICLTHCRYEIVRNIARKYGLREVNEDEQWNIYWTDYSVSIERALDMRRFQIINHFPGMNEICRKDLLAKNLNRMKRLFGREYDIYPKTWSLPADLAELQNYALCRRNKIYICKPEMGCQGRGIFLIRNIKDLNPFGKIVCQLYLAKPFLIDNYKFDLRLYVLITSTDPFRIYLYKEGLARFATAKYKPPTNNNNTENSYMHLTNYAVNKFSRDYVVDDDCGSKRRLTSVWKWLSEHGHNVESVCEEIDDVIIKTLLSAGMILKQNYKYCFPDRTTASACFEILGFDIIFDHKLKPYVLEVNHSPSFHTDAKLDLEIKEGLLDDTFAMLNFKHLSRPKMRTPSALRMNGRAFTALHDFRLYEDGFPFDAEMQASHEINNGGGFRLIYSGQTCDKYDRYLVHPGATDGRSRTAVATALSGKLPSDVKLVSLADIPQEARLAAAASIRSSNSGRTEQETSILSNLKQKESSCISIAEKSPQIFQSFSRTSTATQMIKPPLKKSVPIRNPNPFIPNFISPEEELERTKALMQRGMLVRSLGIEKQVFRLLKDLGSIKPDEQKMYERLYGSGDYVKTIQA